MLRFVFMVTCVFAMVACSTDGDRRRAEYLDADYLTQLELPPDLIEADGSNDLRDTQLKLPKPSAKAMQTYKASLADNKSPKVKGEAVVDLSQKVLPQFDGLNLQSEGGLYWLEIDQSKDNIWLMLLAFWEHEGVAVKTAESMFGIIETEWVTKYRIDESDGFFARLFSKVDRDQSDRFRMRVALGADTSQAKVYIAHSGLERVVEDDEDSSHFVSRASDRELEVEVLSRLLVFMGLTKQNATDLLLHYKPLIKRSHLAEDEKSTIIMTGSEDFVWRYTLHALDRLGLEVVDSDTVSREIKLVIQRLSKEKIGGEADDVAESSYIMQWIRGDGKDAMDDQNKQFILKLSPRSSTSAIQLQDMKREPADSVLAEQLIKGLLIELQ